MRDVTILHDLLKNQCPKIHQKRLNSLMIAVQSLLEGQRLSLTELGRNITGRVAAKHNIKRIDRLLGNPALHQERLDIYRWHAHLLCGANPMPIILVDWSDVRDKVRHLTLRASVSFEGRSVIIYERVFASADHNSPVKSHAPFIKELATILPPNCCPLIVTDAGYGNSWFRIIEAQGWFWLGRVRGHIGFKPFGSKQWHSNKSFYPSANTKARCLGFGELSKRNPIYATLHLYKANAKGRKDVRSYTAGRNHTSQESYRLGAKEPWLLATNLPAQAMTSKQLVNIYAKRMQIEETFRDMKSSQYGLGLRHSNTRCAKRFDILMLIVMLAEWTLRLLGMIATKHNWTREFQANTTRHRRVLSLIRLGREVRKRRRDYPISSEDIRWAIRHYIMQVHHMGMPKL
ncbi:IS4 family transposase [Shewanella avicenniae]|uniref:IS4 family transposase n=1 Tax=Shewanella avicenniae TaxID=2814294 RepID=A0ABX7QX46_9GAMM|nr:IS4 family transposase [Shewanella avicenniae]QSX35545.1 IS4 family transposase [Shewanella avicenniae]